MLKKLDFNYFCEQFISSFTIRLCITLLLTCMQLLVLSIQVCMYITWNICWILKNFLKYFKNKFWNKVFLTYIITLYYLFLFTELNISNQKFISSNKSPFNHNGNPTAPSNMFDVSRACRQSGAFACLLLHLPALWSHYCVFSAGIMLANVLCRKLLALNKRFR